MKKYGFLALNPLDKFESQNDIVFQSSFIFALFTSLHPTSKNPMGSSSILFQGLEVIESTNLKYFTKEMTAEFYALKGMFLAQIGRSDDANKAFSAAVQMHDTLVKAWALWGDYLEQVFTRDK